MTETQTQLALETAEYIDWLDISWDDAGGRSERIRRVWKAGTRGHNEAGLREALAVEVKAIVAEIEAITAEAARLRDPAVTFTAQQLRNDLARLADDVARLARDVIRLGRIALNEYAQPGP